MPVEVRVTPLCPVRICAASELQSLGEPSANPTPINRNMKQDENYEAIKKGLLDDIAKGCDVGVVERTRKMFEASRVGRPCCYTSHRYLPSRPTSACLRSFSGGGAHFPTHIQLGSYRVCRNRCVWQPGRRDTGCIYPNLKEWAPSERGRRCCLLAKAGYGLRQPVPSTQVKKIVLLSCRSTQSMQQPHKIPGAPAMATGGQAFAGYALSRLQP
jgi:hypothetical protein